MELRDYQKEMKSRLYGRWRDGVRSILVQMPTGTGKTVLMAEVIREQAEAGVLVVTHRVELVEQIAETLRRFGVQHGVIAGGKKRVSADRVQVTSIQTLNRRVGLLEFVPGTVVVDEAHHAPAKTYRMLWEWWPAARFVGLTATPCRMGGEPLTDLFDEMLQSWSIGTFIERGWLSDFEYVSADPNSEAVRRVSGLTKRGVDGDYQVKEMATVMDCPESIAHLYDSYKAFADGKKGIVYAINREHARHIADYYTEQGVRCCVVDAKTPAEERRRMVEAYRRGDIGLMVNVDIFSEGWDVPEVEVIQLARPTLSLSKYLQQVGRGMRVADGKSHVVILDQVGTYLTFGMPTENRDWQRLFAGGLRGRGGATQDYPVYLCDEGAEKRLLNLEMVRIKRRNERREGVEIFLLHGKYGIAVDGKMTCAPQFVKVERLPKPYFAMCSYPYDPVYRGKVTVVDERGCDLRSELYGKVEHTGDIFKGTDFSGRQVYWDGRSHKNYTSRPELGRLGRFEIVKQGQAYMFRFDRQGLDFRFRKDEVRVNAAGNILIIGDRLIVSNGKDFNLYEFVGFSRGMILAKLTGRNIYRLIMDTGNSYCDYKPPYTGAVSRTPDMVNTRFYLWQGF